MSRASMNSKKLLSRAMALMLPLLFVPLSVETGAVEPQVACGAEADGGGNCTFAPLHMCYMNGEIIQDAEAM